MVPEAGIPCAMIFLDGLQEMQGFAIHLAARLPSASSTLALDSFSKERTVASRATTASSCSLTCLRNSGVSSLHAFSSNTFMAAKGTGLVRRRKEGGAWLEEGCYYSMG